MDTLINKIGPFLFVTLVFAASVAIVGCAALLEMQTRKPGRLRCALGIHSWRCVGSDDGMQVVEHRLECERCARKKVVAQDY